MMPHERKHVEETFASDRAQFERMMGTVGDGMDQAIQFLTERGPAGNVKFQPRSSNTPINLRTGAKLRISHSGASCNKETRSHFNILVSLCICGQLDSLVRVKVFFE